MPSYPTSYDDWIADAELTAKYHGARWVSGPYNDSVDNAITYGQYEPWYGFRRLADHLSGDAELETYAEAAEDAWRPYSTGNSGGIPGYYNYTDGFRLDWLRNGDTVTRDALIDQAVSAAFATGSSASEMKDQELSREVAYACLGYINSEVFCDEAHNSRLEPMLDLILGDVSDSVNIGGSTTLTNGGHIEQWLGGLETDENGDVVEGTENLHRFDEGGFAGEVEQGFAPFMGAITGWTLIAQYENAAAINGGVTPDARTIPKLVRLFDGMWPYYWVDADDSMKLRWIDTDGAPALNNEMAPIYWWLYLQTSEERFKDRGDLLFNGTAGYQSLTYRGEATSSYLSKEFNELLRWTIDGLEWRAEGVGGMAFTSKASGNWSASGQTTWNEVGVPGNGDTVTITAGHTVTVDVNTTVGDSPSTAADVITCTTSGALTVAPGVTFIIKGCVTLEDGSFTLGAGSIVEFQVPSTKRYWFRPTTNHFDTGKLVINGSIGSRAAFRSSSGAGIAYIDSNGLLDGSIIQAEYCDFTRIGDATESFCEPWPVSSGMDFRLRNCTLTSCGAMATVSNINPATNFELLNTKWVTTVASKCMTLNAADPPTGGNTRSIIGCAFDKSCEFYEIVGWTITNTYFADSYLATSSGSSTGWVLFEDNLVAKTDTSPTIIYEDMADCFIYKPSGSNPHFLQLPAVRDATVSGCVFEFGGTDDNGDCFLVSSPSVAAVFSFTGNIVLPNAAGDTSGTLFSALGNSNVTFSANHNTYFNNAAGRGPAIAETYTGHSGMLTSFRSNLCWSDTAGEAEVLEESASNSAVSGYVTNNGYNGCWNPRATRYDLDVGTVTNDLTANDVTGDPSFYDETRDLASWDASLGGAGTNTAALARIAADPYLIDDLVAWVKVGFTPQNAAFDGTAHDGGDIGAVAYATFVPVNTVAPSVSIFPYDTLVFSSDTGTWTNSPTSYTYQWRLANDGSGTGAADISGATSASLTMAAAYWGKYVRCVVTATNADGSTSANATLFGATWVYVFAPVAREAATYVEADWDDFATEDGAELFDETVGDSPNDLVPFPLTFNAGLAAKYRAPWFCVASEFLGVVGRATDAKAGCGATLISPTHVLMVHHCRPSAVYFKQANGTEIYREIEWYDWVNTDLSVGRLDAEVTTIDPVPVLVSGSQAVNQYAVLLECNRTLSRVQVTDNGSFISVTPSVIESGDSGHPIFAMLGDQAVLLAIVTGAGTSEVGHTIAANIDRINAVLDVQGESLTLIGLEGGGGIGPVHSPARSPYKSPIKSPLSHRRY